jgi:hypothetical protein
MHCLFHPPWLDHSNFIWRTVQVVKLLIMQFSPMFYHFIPLRSKYSPRHPVSPSKKIPCILWNPDLHYRRTSTYELSINEQFVFTNIARTNKFRLLIHLTNTEPLAYEHFNKFNDISHGKNKFNLWTFNLQTHFKEYIIFVSWGLLVFCSELVTGSCTEQF